MNKRLLSSNSVEAGVPVVRATSGEPTPYVDPRTLTERLETEVDMADWTRAEQVAQVTGSLAIIGERP